MGDADRYEAVAHNVGVLVHPPWGCRIGIPYLAAGLIRATGLGLASSFVLLQILLYAGLLAATFLWAGRVLNLGRSGAALLCLLLACSFPAVYNLHNTTHVGFAEHLLILLGFIAIQRERFLPLAVLLLAAGFVKESVGAMLIPVFAFSVLFTRRPVEAAVRTALLGGIFVVVFLVLRSGLLYSGREGLGTYSSFYSAYYFEYVYGWWGGIRRALFQMLATFGPLWVLALAGFLLADWRQRMLGVLIPVAILETVLATDVARVVGLSFPAVLLLAAVCFERLDTRARVALTSINAVYFLSWNHNVGFALVMLGSMLGTIGILVWALRVELNDEGRAMAGYARGRLVRLLLVLRGGL